MDQLTRRAFVKRSVAAGATLTAASYSSILGANDDIRVAVVGFNGQGAGHIRGFHKPGAGSRVVALCDVDEKVLYGRQEEFKKRGETVATHIDFRKLLEDKTIDVVSIATPEHQHITVASHAVLAGKDAYVEKPLSHTIAEGRYFMELAQKHGRIIQHGTQSRSTEGVREGIEFVKSGKLGKCRVAKAINCQVRKPIGHKDDQPAPSHVHYDLWLGPAPVRSFNENRYHYQWHWWWDYGSGDCGNDGSHQVDIARWGLGVELPMAVTCSGGQLWYKDDHETPDTQMATFEYRDCHVIYEMRLWTGYPQEGDDKGNVFYCDEGWVSIGRKGWEAYSKDGKKVGGAPRGAESHKENFLKAVRSRKPADANADVREGYYTSALCHSANIAMRVGGRLSFDPKTEKFVGDGSVEANRLRTKTYRKGFELPGFKG
jgi:predicted dehydrogenase